MELVDQLIAFFNAYGYYFLFLAAMLENIPIIGVFLPGEVIVVAAGFFAATDDFNIVVVITVACIGALTGSTISYFLGYRGGRRLIEIMAARFKVDLDRIEKADKYFSTHGPITVFVGRYLTGVKALIPALAGAHKMKFHKFLPFAILGVVSWTVLAGLLGFYFGANWQFLIRLFRTTSWAIALVAIALAVVIWLRRKK